MLALLLGVGVAQAQTSVPAAPSTPTVSKTDGTSLKVDWTAPADGGSAITDYDVQYRRKGATDWTDAEHTGTGLTVTIAGVTQGASWEAQVRATNSVGTSAWS